jgi:hypothetical protein
MPDDNGNTGMGDADLAAARYALSLALGLTVSQRDELIAAVSGEEQRRAIDRLLTRNRNRKGAEHD